MMIKIVDKSKQYMKFPIGHPVLIDKFVNHGLQRKKLQFYCDHYKTMELEQVGELVKTVEYAGHKMSLVRWYFTSSCSYTLVNENAWEEFLYKKTTTEYRTDDNGFKTDDGNWNKGLGLL